MNLSVQIAQLNFLVGDIEGNAQRVIELAQAAQPDVQAIVFPELALTGYPPEDLLLRDDFIQRVELALQKVQAAAGETCLILGYPRRVNGLLYNMAGVFQKGEIIVEYQKQLLPNYSVFDEKRYFTPGNRAATFELNGVTAGITICEDIWSPEPTAMACAAGAQLLFNLNASPFHTGKAPERESLVQQRAREHGIPIIYTNLVGGQDELVFDGGSFVVDAGGKIKQRLPFYAEAQTLIRFRTA